jgi:hypothetical protein
MWVTIVLPQSIFGLNSPFAFTGSTLIGLGIGLMMTSILSTFRRRK